METPTMVLLTSIWLLLAAATGAIKAVTLTVSEYPRRPGAVASLYRGPPSYHGASGTHGPRRMAAPYIIVSRFQHPNCYQHYHDFPPTRHQFITPLVESGRQFSYRKRPDKHQYLSAETASATAAGTSHDHRQKINYPVGQKEFNGKWEIIKPPKKEDTNVGRIVTYNSDGTRVLPEPIYNYHTRQSQLLWSPVQKAHRLDEQQQQRSENETMTPLITTTTTISPLTTPSKVILTVFPSFYQPTQSPPTTTTPATPISINSTKFEQSSFFTKLGNNAKHVFTHLLGTFLNSKIKDKAQDKIRQSQDVVNVGFVSQIEPKQNKSSEKELKVKEYYQFQPPFPFQSPNETNENEVKFHQSRFPLQSQDLSQPQVQNPFQSQNLSQSPFWFQFLAPNLNQSQFPVPSQIPHYFQNRSENEFKNIESNQFWSQSHNETDENTIEKHKFPFQSQISSQVRFSEEIDPTTITGWRPLLKPHFFNNNLLSTTDTNWPNSQLQPEINDTIVDEQIPTTISTTQIDDVTNSITEAFVEETNVASMEEVEEETIAPADEPEPRIEDFSNETTTTKRSLIDLINSLSELRNTTDSASSGDEAVHDVIDQSNVSVIVMPQHIRPIEDDEVPNKTEINTVDVEEVTSAPKVNVTSSQAVTEVKKLYAKVKFGIPFPFDLIHSLVSRL